MTSNRTRRRRKSPDPSDSEEMFITQAEFIAHYHGSPLLNPPYSEIFSVVEGYDLMLDQRQLSGRILLFQNKEFSERFLLRIVCQDLNFQDEYIFNPDDIRASDFVASKVEKILIQLTSIAVNQQQQLLAMRDYRGRQ